MDDRKKNEISEPFGDLMRSINQFFQETPVKGFLQEIDNLLQTPFSFATSFQVETSENENEYVIMSKLPGINREQIGIDIFDRYITISIHSSEALIEEDENWKLTRRQQSIQRTSRTIPLPQPINEKTVKASFENERLQIRVPKQKGKTILLD